MEQRLDKFHLSWVLLKRGMENRAKRKRNQTERNFINNTNWF